MGQLRRTINYRIVEWLNVQPNIVDLLRICLNARPTVADTAFANGSEICEVRHRSVLPNEIRLHISAHIPGAEKGIRPHANAEEADLSTAPPPQGAEFTEREIAMVVRENHIAYVSMGRVHGSTIRNILVGLIRLHHGADVANGLVLSARADPEAISGMLQDGVDTFELGLSLPHVEADEIVNGQPASISQRIGRSIVDGISARFTEDHRDADLDELANMHVTLNLKAGRKKSQAKIRALTAIATDAVENDEEFTLKTLSGAKISREKLLITSGFDQPGNVPVLSYLIAWNRSSEFLDSL